MPVFEYQALTNQGKTIKGFIDADSLAQARSRLRANGSFPVSIKESDKAKGHDRKRNIRLFERVKSQEISVVTRQLATLLGAGIPLVQSLGSLIEQTSNKVLKRIIAQVKDDVNEGSTLTAALQNHPKLFSSIFVNMVKAGEASGSLDVVLEKLADFSEKQDALRARLQAALIYPAFMAVVGAGILFILITYIVPNITQVFEEMDRVLPTPTQLLIGFSDLLRAKWWLLIVLLFICVMGLRFFASSQLGRSVFDKLKFKTPVLGNVVHKILLARFSSTMASLLDSGVGLLTSMQIVRALVNNVHMAEVIDGAILNIQKGKSMTDALAQSDWFPPMFTQMLAVGEQSGQLETMLHKIAAAYEREVDAAVSGLTALIEPMMIVGMGLAVGFIVLSILLPIFEMNQMIG